MDLNDLEYEKTHDLNLTLEDISYFHFIFPEP